MRRAALRLGLVLVFVGSFCAVADAASHTVAELRVMKAAGQINVELDAGLTKLDELWSCAPAALKQGIDKETIKIDDSSDPNGLKRSVTTFKCGKPVEVHYRSADLADFNVYNAKFIFFEELIHAHQVQQFPLDKAGGGAGMPAAGDQDFADAERWYLEVEARAKADNEVSPLSGKQPNIQGINMTDAAAKAQADQAAAKSKADAKRNLCDALGKIPSSTGQGTSKKAKGYRKFAGCKLLTVLFSW